MSCWHPPGSRARAHFARKREHGAFPAVAVVPSFYFMTCRESARSGCRPAGAAILLIKKRWQSQVWLRENAEHADHSPLALYFSLASYILITNFFKRGRHERHTDSARHFCRLVHYQSMDSAQNGGTDLTIRQLQPPRRGGKIYTEHRSEDPG